MLSKSSRLTALGLSTPTSSSTPKSKSTLPSLAPSIGINDKDHNNNGEGGHISRRKIGKSKSDSKAIKESEKLSVSIPLVEPLSARGAGKSFEHHLPAPINGAELTTILPFRTDDTKYIPPSLDSVPMNNILEADKKSPNRDKGKALGGSKLTRLTKSPNGIGVFRRRSSHEMVLNSQAHSPSKDMMGSFSRDNRESKGVAEIVVEDDTLAQTNDRIIQDRLQQAKALNRKIDTGNGANMHSFSLWNKKASPSPSHGVSTAAPAKQISFRMSPSEAKDYEYMTGDYENGKATNMPIGSRQSAGRGLANALRQTVASTSIASQSSDDTSARIMIANSTDSVEEIDELQSRHNDVESVCSIEEEEELRRVVLPMGTPARRRSYSEGEILPFVRHYSSEDVHSFVTRTSPSLSEASRESDDEDEDNVGAVSTIAQSQRVSLFASRQEEIDFSDSTMRWKQGEFLGEGSFGAVYKGMNEATGELIAVKQLFLSGDSDDEVRLLRKEISVMWNLNHINIVRYLGTAKTTRCLYILLEYVPGGSIAYMLKQFGAFTESLLKRFTKHIVRGADYLHSKGIIHRDIKGANVLVGVDGIAKLSDFGCSKKVVGVCTTSLEESMKVMQGSVPWMAPEVIKQTGYGFSSDIWSIGATMIEMSTGVAPWTEFTSNLATLFHIANLNEPPPIPPNLTSSCSKFILKCVCIDPKRRATASELIVDHFLNSE